MIPTNAPHTYESMRLKRFPEKQYNTPERRFFEQTGQGFKEAGKPIPFSYECPGLLLKNYFLTS